uniref:Uncharacterized protein n=1 Tax=Picea sitchensis TaxID=3332 RepID=A9NM81_PICSI|nr:unknown [Picea sitchensis]
MVRGRKLKVLLQKPRQHCGRPRVNPLKLRRKRMMFQWKKDILLSTSLTAC